MALINRNINLSWDYVEDRLEQSLGWSDVDIKLEKALNGDIIKDTGVNAVKNSLFNILNTVQGQRRMLPDFALPIYNLLFEPISEETAHRLGNLIVEAINTWDDRPAIENLNITAKPDSNMYECTLYFKIKGRDTTYDVDFILERV